MCIADLYDVPPIERRSVAVWDRITTMNYDARETLRAVKSLSMSAAAPEPPLVAHPLERAAAGALSKEAT